MEWMKCHIGFVENVRALFASKTMWGTLSRKFKILNKYPKLCFCDDRTMSPVSKLPIIVIHLQVQCELIDENGMSFLFFYFVLLVNHFHVNQSILKWNEKKKSPRSSHQEHKFAIMTLLNRSIECVCQPKNLENLSDWSNLHLKSGFCCRCQQMISLIEQPITIISCQQMDRMTIRDEI